MAAEGYLSNPASLINRMRMILNNGIDLSDEVGSSVYAAANGEVQVVGGLSDQLGSSLGNYVILYHGKKDDKGIRTVYAHNSEILVTKGQKIKRGQEIARIGNSGRPITQERGVLHFEIWDYDQTVDPSMVLPPIKN